MNLRKVHCMIPVVLMIAVSVICMPVIGQNNPSSQVDSKSVTTKEALPKGVPDVQVMVGPSVRGYTVAFVFPKKVEVKTVGKLVESFSKLSKAEVSGLTVETSRLEHEPGAKIEKEPLMTSATFETKSALVDRQSGGLFPEKLILALQEFDRVQVTFLVDQAFVYSKAKHYASDNLNVDLYGQQGAFTFVANIHSRPVSDFLIPDQDIVNARTKPGYNKSFGLPVVLGGIALICGFTVMFAVRRRF